MILAARIVGLISAGAVLAMTGSRDAEETRSMETRCHREVIELHRFFESWFNARSRDDDSSFERVAAVISPSFEIIGPDGILTTREPLLLSLRGAHGQRPGISIEIRDPRARALGDDLCLATYQEWQITGGAARGWISSALMRKDDTAPNGLVWLRVHETYLPGGDPPRNR